MPEAEAAPPASPFRRAERVSRDQLAGLPRARPAFGPPAPIEKDAPEGLRAMLEETAHLLESVLTDLEGPHLAPEETRDASAMGRARRVHMLATRLTQVV